MKKDEKKELKQNYDKQNSGKAGAIVFCALFVILLILPAVAIPLFADAVNTEKRELAEFPSLRTEEGKWNTDFSDEFDAWVQDHIGFRSILVEANSKLRANIFHQSSEESIVLGTDEWLFYSDTVNDFLNVPTMTTRNVNGVAHSLKMMQDYVTADGTKFVVAFIPNKNTLYPEHMPYNYVAQDTEGNLELLENALAANGVSYADVRSAFEKQTEVLYQSQDSHWNYKGALLGYQTILSATGIDYNSFEGMTFTEREDWESDLATMLYSDQAKPGRQLYPDYTFQYEYTSHEQKVDSLLLTTHNDAGNGNAVVYRDSFCNTMQVYVAENFENAAFTRVYPYSVDYIADNDADVAIIELVERNLINLAKKAPVMQAPSVSLNANATSVSTENFSMYSEESGNYIHYFGEVPEELLGEDYQVYLLCRDADGSMSSYEAFPIFEQELLEAEMLQDNGYSIYLDENQIQEGQQYYIIVESDGNYYVSGEITPEK